jgi:hypothetical protein
MSRWAVAATLAGCVVAAVAALALVAAGDKRTFAFSPAIRPLRVVAVAGPGTELCQRGIEREAKFDSVSFDYGTFGRPGPPLRMTVEDSATRRVLARGAQPGGYPDNHSTTTRVSPALGTGGPIDVCVTNAGNARVALYGAPGAESAPSTAYRGRTAIYPLYPVDIAVEFFDSRGHSTLSQVPAIFRRASILRPSWVGGWTFWVLLAGLVVGVPALLLGALRRAESGDEPPASA